jgi:hypothetical protein
MPFGLTPICFIVLNKIAIFLKKRRTHTNFQNEFIAFATALLVTQIVSVILLNYFSQNSFEYFLLAINIMITLIFYPVIRQILRIFYFY